MSLASFRTLNFLPNSLLWLKQLDKISHVRYASKTAGTPGIAGLGSKLGKVTPSSISVKISVLPVETNVERLQTHLCGSNILKEGEDDVELKPDNEYPDWLWKLNVGAPPHFSELSPDSKPYWKQVKKIHFQQQKRIKERKRF